MQKNIAVTPETHARIKTLAQSHRPVWDLGWTVEWLLDFYTNQPKLDNPGLHPTPDSEPVPDYETKAQS